MSAIVEVVLTCDQCGTTHREPGVTVNVARDLVGARGWTLRQQEGDTPVDWCHRCSAPQQSVTREKRPRWSNHHTFLLADLMTEVDGVLWQDGFSWQVLEFVTGNGTRGSVHLDMRGRFHLGHMGGSYWQSDHRTHAFTRTPRQQLDAFSDAVRAANTKPARQS